MAAKEQRQIKVSDIEFLTREIPSYIQKENILYLRSDTPVAKVLIKMEFLGHFTSKPCGEVIPGWLKYEFMSKASLDECLEHVL